MCSRLVIFSYCTLAYLIEKPPSRILGNLNSSENCLNYIFRSSDTIVPSIVNMASCCHKLFAGFVRHEIQREIKEAFKSHLEKGEKISSFGYDSTITVAGAEEFKINFIAYLKALFEALKHTMLSMNLNTALKTITSIGIFMEVILT